MSYFCFFNNGEIREYDTLEQAKAMYTELVFTKKITKKVYFDKLDVNEEEYFNADRNTYYLLKDRTWTLKTFNLSPKAFKREDLNTFSKKLHLECKIVDPNGEVRKIWNTQNWGEILLTGQPLNDFNSFVSLLRALSKYNTWQEIELVKENFELKQKINNLSISD